MAPSRKNPDAGPPVPDVAPDGRVAKYRLIFDHLLAGIESGRLKPGARLPSEAELGKLFGASRITVAKAVLELQRRGLVTRRPGAGTHVRGPEQPAGHAFGLIVPELGQADVLDRLCHGLIRTPQARSHSFVWSSTPPAGVEIATEAEQMAEPLVGQKVAGAFFLPLEFAQESDAINRRILRSLDRAQIPVVLLDHDISPYPHRTSHDVVGMDHRLAGFIAASHLLHSGARRLVFFAEAPSGSRVEARAAGFCEALRHAQLRPDYDPVWRGSAEDETLICRIKDEIHSDAIVCAHDLTAAHLMQTLLGLGVAIPEQVRLVGIDDMKYASLLPVPLTTVQQDFSGIGAAAMVALLDRIQHPALPSRQVLLPGKLIVRRSCGAKAS